MSAREKIAQNCLAARQDVMRETERNEKRAACLAARIFTENLLDLIAISGNEHPRIQMRDKRLSLQRYTRQDICPRTS